MKTFRRILLGVGLSVLAAGLAGATTLTQTFTLSPTQTDITGTQGTGTFSDFLTLCPTCSASWLTGVTVEISASENLVSLSLKNTDTTDTSNAFDYQTYANLGVVATGAATGSSTAIRNSLQNNEVDFASGNGCTVQPGAGYINLCDTGTVTYLPNQTINYGPITATDDSGAVTVGNITPYDTAGTFTLGFTTTTHQSFVGGGGQDSNSQSTTANGVVTVTYNYTVPGPPPAPRNPPPCS